MEKVGKMIAVFAVVAAVVVVGIFAFRQWSAGQILDGPGMVYDVRDYELKGEWVEVGNVYGDPGTLKFTRSSVTYKVYEGSRHTAYELAKTGALAEGEERRIDFTDRGPYEYMVLHREKVGDEEIGILSGICIELDGRGPVVLGEYVLKENVKKVPEGFESAVCIRENNKKATSTYIELPYFDDVLTSTEWLGKSIDDDVFSDCIIREEGLFAEIVFQGQLFGRSCGGHADFTLSHGADEPRTVERISAMCYEIGFADCRQQMAARFGEPTSEGEEPYAVSNGGALEWAYFTDGVFEYKISQGSNNDWVSLDIAPLS